ncbi:HD domain-containing phosphohydrolase [Aminipila luticellarii]|uniref:Stage 0 sporulation protein A homolog n=1 Tax=Aminipila luticellarii TaxID=2507160 RepID=A0A410PUJ2_9FIRM|nr:HD domain-containing phosphohydrolase [Aminipila luticellarii]QAT42536.1 response regulator [Aminipila luticellarii]
MQQMILIVDDNRSNIKIAQTILEKEYRVAAALSGKKAIQFLTLAVPDLILLDIYMPDMNGFEVMEELKLHKEWKDIPVIFLTANSEPKTEARCFQMGAVDFISKPFIPEVIKNRINRTLELQAYRKNLEDAVKNQSRKILQQARELAHKQQELMAIQQEVIIGMANLIEGRDGSTGGHIKRTSQYVELIARALKEKGIFSDILTEEYIENLCKAAPLHDIGKICISDVILQKPGKLTEEEFDIMKTHAERGGEVIRSTMAKIEKQEFIDIAFDIATYHHEKWNGQGYPKGLTGRDIPLSARIMAVADVFDALVSKRCYKEPMDSEEAFEIIKVSGGSHFDPEISNVFLELRDRVKEISRND